MGIKHFFGWFKKNFGKNIKILKRDQKTTLKKLITPAPQPPVNVSSKEKKNVHFDSDDDDVPKRRLMR